MITYISLRFETNIGAKVHRSILEELFGEDNIYTIDLRPRNQERKLRYICYGKYKNPLDRIFRWIQGNTMYISNKIINEICNIIGESKSVLVFLENSNFGSLVKKIKTKYPNIKVICFYHDIDADLYRQWSKESNWVGKIENKIGIKQEMLSQRYSDIDIVFNKRDAQLYEKYYKNKPNYIIPLSSYKVDLNETFLEMKPSAGSDRKKLLFVGSKYYPNLEGIRWFYKNVIPGLNNKIQINIVGRGTEILRSEMDDSRVHVLGTVDDVFQYLYDADIFIAPLFSGGGMKAKSIEAISLGKCFVGNDESLAGFWEEMDDTVRNKVIFNCETAGDWIKTINALSEKEIQKFYPELYKIFIDKFSYDKTKEAFIEMLQIKGEKN